MKILVTGSAGFIGTHLVQELKNRGHEVEEFDLEQGKDITERHSVSLAVKGKDFVFHLAGLLGTHELVDNTAEAVKVNILGTVNILDACKRHKVKLIEISKPNVWLNTYSITKECSEKFTEMYRKEHGLEAAVVKWFNVYGTGQKIMEEVGYKKAFPTWIVNGIKGEDIEIYGNGKQTVDLVHTKDTIDATICVMDKFSKCEGETFEVGAEEIELNDVAKMIQRETGGKSKIVHIPMRKGETDNTRIRADLSKIRDLTGWKPKMTLEKSIKDIIKWYKTHYQLS